MIRKIIKIDEDLCNGCGLCVNACHEGALSMIDGKAKLLRDDYCDGLGDCLPACPAGAISFEEREAAAYDEEAVNARMAQKQQQTSGCNCPGTKLRMLHKPSAPAQASASRPENPQFEPVSQLRQWPVQIKLVPANAPYLQNAHLLIAADCTAYAHANFHTTFMQNRITLIGCPKLDQGDYAEKLTTILKENDIKSVTVVRMEVPCCGGMEAATKTALINSGKMIPWQVVTIAVDGAILDGMNI